MTLNQLSDRNSDFSIEFLQKRRKIKNIQIFGEQKTVMLLLATGITVFLVFCQLFPGTCHAKYVRGHLKTLDVSAILFTGPTLNFKVF